MRTVDELNAEAWLLVPDAPQQLLADIAARYPHLRVRVAAHPMAYPELIRWIGEQQTAAASSPAAAFEESAPAAESSETAAAGATAESAIPGAAASHGDAPDDAAPGGGVPDGPVSDGAVSDGAVLGGPRPDGAASEDKMTAGEIALGTASIVGEALLDGAKDALYTLLWNGMLWGGLIIAWLLPVAGIPLGIIGLLMAIRWERSWLLPIVTIGSSIFAWVATGTPMGFLSVLVG